MENSQPAKDDGIDLFELIETLWDGKVILVAFVVAALTICSLFLALNREKYVTTATYEIKPSPPFLEMNELQADISRTFFAAKTFVRWKESRPGTSLTVDLIDQTEIIEGASFAMPKAERLITFDNNLINIYSNDTQLIFEVLDYFEFVGLTLSEIYFVEGKREKNRLYELDRQLFAKLSSNDALSALENIASLERFLEKAAGGQQLLLISLPFPPQRMSAPKWILFVLAIALGGFSGAVCLIVRKAYKARKLQLSGLNV